MTAGTEALARALLTMERETGRILDSRIERRTGGSTDGK